MDKKNWVETTLKSMSLHEKVGQVFVIPFWFINKSNIETALEIIDKYNIGGRFALSESPEDLIESNEIIQKEAKIPLLVGSDLESGPGQALKKCQKFPFQMCRAACGDEELEYEIGKATALQGTALGVNFTASPVLDANINRFCPDVNIRAYSTNPEKIISMGTAYIKGLQEHGMLAQAKHYPGNGATGVDQHIAPVPVDIGKEEMYELYLRPYKEVIEKADLASVMVGHIEVPSLTNEKNPVTGRTIVSSLSHKILKDILRDKLGFKGFAMSDALNMGGINNDFSASEMAVKAIAAGMDSLLAFNAQEIDSLHSGIIRAVEDGTLAEKELDRAVRNVLTAKARLNLHRNGGLPVNKKELNRILLDTDRYKQIEKDVSERSITILSNRNDIIPLDVAGKKILTLNSYGPDRIVMEARGIKLCENFVPGFLKDAGAEVKDIEVAAVMTGEEANTLNAGIADAEIIIFNMFHSPTHAVGYNLFPNHCVSGLFYQGIFNKDIPIIVISFGDPFIIDHCPSAPVYICAYNQTELSQKAAIDVCLGKLKPQGKSPIDFKYYIKYGDGLTI